jgi:molybdopterin/thiamine biosynthesis adenylyltransferase
MTNNTHISAASDAAWCYREAFSRNQGLISRAEQEKISNSRIAIAGMGGVGGLHLITLVRLGFTKFSIADPDEFTLANFNRQYGASMATLCRNKAEVMAEAARDINPELDIEFFPAHVDGSNIDEFLEGCAVYVDGLDFFAIEARRMLFRKARERGMWSITAGPLGFSTAWLSFDPKRMSFDQYFDLNDGQSRADQLVAFAVGLTPKATHRSYMDLSQVKIESGVGPSVSAACQLASGVAAAEVVKMVLGRGGTRPAPYYAQFDAYRSRLIQGRLRFGNRHPLQQIKRRLFMRYLRKQGVV